ncbi:uncharacterized protein LOC135489274 [Lineus longissimus]|uniref:uncharacterized protein LOC135489274 n=1 Tax=Lineus longissimus TaxID=88925 RepID=UPI00315D3BE7
MSTRSGHEKSQPPIQLVPPPPSNCRELCSTVAPRRRHDYAVDIEPDFPPMFRTSLSSACSLLQESEESLVESGMASDTNTSLVQLERLLAELGSYPYVSQGVFYMMAVHNKSSSSLCDRDIIRFVESGSFLGFFHNKRDDIPSEGPGYRVYSEADLSDMKEKSQERTASIRVIRSAKSGKQVQGRNRSGEVYSKKVKAIQKHIAVCVCQWYGCCHTGAS